MKIKYLSIFAVLILYIQCKTQQEIADEDLITRSNNYIRNSNFTIFQGWTIWPRDYNVNNYAYFFYPKNPSDSIKLKYLSEQQIRNNQLAIFFTIRKLSRKDTAFVVDTAYNKPNYRFFGEYFGVSSKQQILDSMMSVYKEFKKLNVYGLRVLPPPKNVYYFAISEHIELIYFANDFDGIEKYKKDLIQIDEKWYYKIKPK